MSAEESRIASIVASIPEPCPFTLSHLHDKHVPLYPQGVTRRRDPQHPAVDSLFLAHYDIAAFGHSTTGQPDFGTKVTATVKLIAGMRRKDPTSKCVVFSSYSRTLQLIEVAMRLDAELGVALRLPGGG
eukprot:CAMPEP_0169463472 /NCGR_PEP_ID=MMETSP1042-20121227/20132_1 /TAXON_ID=464988 /ORGANISM="Hemiselmis andersenii, Strain CCMP1180" /LENGTH=128 /DNA_ID=CAMNT_0009576219 /DNA_START=270 /DNA_END=653 /DNA_ORIENTATION=+